MVLWRFDKPERASETTNKCLGGTVPPKVTGQRLYPHPYHLRVAPRAGHLSMRYLTPYIPSGPDQNCFIHVLVLWERTVHTLPDRQPIENVRSDMFRSSTLSCYVSAVCWVLYDHLLTLEDEVVYVWRRPLRSGTILFYVVRYLGLLSLVCGTVIYARPMPIFTIPGECPEETRRGSPVVVYLTNIESVVFLATPALQFSIFWAVEVVLQTRIYALYNSRTLAIANGILFTAEVAGMLILWQLVPELAVCNAGSGKWWSIDDPVFQCKYFALYWIPGIAFELWLAGLALARLPHRILKRDLLSVMVHDGVKYFVLVAVVMLVHVISTLKNMIGQYAIPFVIAGQTIGGSRMILHLRKAYFESRDGGASKAARMSFAVRTSAAAAVRNRFVDETFAGGDAL